MTTALWVALALAVSTGARADAPWTDSGPVERLHWKPSAFTLATHAIATASIVVDILYTLDFKNHPRMTETNPILGPRPSDLAIVGYGLGAVALTTGLWLALPDELRPLADVLTLAVQLTCIQGHLDMGLTMRLPF